MTSGRLRANPAPRTGAAQLAAVRRELKVETTRRHAAELAARKAQETLKDVVESVSEAFVIFDRDDRFVMGNEANRRLYHNNPAGRAPGVSFEDMLRLGIANGLYPDAVGREEAWIADRLRHHRELDGAVEQRLAGGRHLLITERRMRNGGTAGLRIDVTRQKETEIKLRELSERLERIQQIAGVGSLEVAIDTGFVSWSPAACAIFGVAPADVQPTIGYVLSFVHPNDRELVAKEGAAARASGIPAPPMEYRIIRPDGAERVVYRNNALTRDANGRPVSRIITFKDVTDLRVAEARLREMRDNLNRAQRLAHVGTFTRDPAGVAQWSAEMYRIFGVDPQIFKPTRTNLMRRILPEDRPAAMAVFRQLARGISPAPFEYRLRRPNGEIRFVYCFIELLRDRDDRIIGTGGTIWDITEMRRSEVQLRAMMDNLDRAQRLAHMGSYTRDVDGTGRWSAEVYRIFGVDPQTFTPDMDSFLRMVLPDDRPHVIAAHRRMEEGQCPDSFEYRIRRPNGEIRYIHRIDELIRDRDGNVTGMGGMLWDITELREAEERQKELERQLLHSQKLEALGRLAGGVAHDLNNTLVPILSLAKLALEDLSDGDPLHDDIATIVSASERARDLVKQILAFSRKQDIQKSRIEPAGVVRAALHMLRATLPLNITFVERIDTVPPIFADGGQLQQVVVNLVTNAAQAIGTARGSISLELSAEARAVNTSRRGDVVRLRIADTGCGMAKAVLDRIFEPFFTTKPVGEGTGLGLAVVHGIVVGHGGTIDVESRPGKGTTFTILLPIAEPASANLEAAA
jgi:two-component system, cell cycle sensor histidine kinase and response regulator CckA